LKPLTFFIFWHRSPAEAGARKPPPRRRKEMRKVELVEALGKFLEFDEEMKEWLRRRLRHYPEHKIDGLSLYVWVHGLVGKEGTKAYLVKSNGEVYELDYGVTRISDGGRVIDNEDEISLIDALATSDVDVEPGDVVVIREFCFRDDRDFRDEFYYIRGEEIAAIVKQRRKQIEEEQI